MKLKDMKLKAKNKDFVAAIFDLAEKFKMSYEDCQNDILVVLAILSEGEKITNKLLRNYLGENK